ncbi:MAG: hypothetical protein K2W96_24450 [Gemmataceae bacterium]|nr:hypothetical protein [Gemmataceae bacterium]
MADIVGLLQGMWQGARRFTPRLWRLFACGCARRTGRADRPPLADVLALVERYADGEATAHELASARFGFRHRAESMAHLLAWMPDMAPLDMLRRLMTWLAGEDPALVSNAAPEVFADLLGPELPAPAPMLLAWEGGLVRRLARGIYEDRAWDRLPYLGDALEEAGCAAEEVLAHCRAGGAHSRGCWAVDWVLGKR